MLLTDFGFLLMLIINLTMWLGWVPWSAWADNAFYGGVMVVGEIYFWAYVLSLVLSVGSKQTVSNREAARQALRSQIDGLSAQMLSLVSDRSWSNNAAAIAEYHRLDLQQAKLELAYHSEYGQEHDRWNYAANMQAARKHLAEAEAE